MAGHPDKEKRRKVRKYLLTKAGQRTTDRGAAKELGVSKNFVASIRRQLLADGLVPFPDAEDLKYLGHREVFKPGATARGGYVYDERGRVVEKAYYLAKQAAKSKKNGKPKAGRATKLKRATG